ncbi:MAG: oligosaccharide flippase family protein [Flavobacterium sp.]|jgi:O-antigen/teichoic acid export membrane protein|nr:oligosaccharide flippase family protein [Flavobacterium sp.]
MYKKQIDFLTYIIGQAVNLVTPLVITPYLLFTCGAEGLGKNAVGFSVAMFLILVIDYAFEMKSTRDIAATNDKAIIAKIINHVISAKLVLLLLLSVVFYTSIWLFSAQLENAKLFALSFLIVVAQAFSPLSILQGLQWYRTTAVINISSKLIYLLLVLNVVSETGDYLWVNPFWAIANFAAFITGYFIVFTRLQLSFIPSSPIQIFQTLRTDFSYTTSQLLLCLRQIAPQILSGYFLGWQTAGIYKIFDQLISLARTMNQVYFKFFFPKLSGMLTTEKRGGVAFWKQYSALAFVGTFFMSCLAFYFKTEVLLFFKMTSNQVQSTGNLYLITLFTVIVMPITIAGEQLMVVFDLLKTYTRIIYTVSALTVIGIIFTAPTFGLEGIATIVLIAEILFASQYIGFTRQKITSFES